MAEAHPMKFAYLWLVCLIPPALAALYLCARLGERRRRKLMDRFTGDPGRYWSAPGFSQTRRQLGLALSLASIAFLMLTLPRPLIYSKANESELQGVHYIFAVDASRSMLATDVYPTRYGAVSNALDRWLTDVRADKVGLITFAGDAFLNAPVTFDTAALATVLRFIEPDDIFEGGSALAKAIERAAHYFVSNNIPERLVVIFSDGEELEGSALETARECRRKFNLITCTVGVGTATGGKVPANRRTGAWGNAKNSFGLEVTTRLDEGNLKRIAYAGGGRYYQLGPKGEGLEQLKTEVLRPLAEAAAKENLQNYSELYHIPLVLALICSLGHLCVRPDSHQRRVEINGHLAIR
jgi:Ca-activated chloride channel homolog